MLTEKIMPRFSETDVLGHINNTVLPVWFEAARAPIFKIFTPDLNPHNWKLIVAKVEVVFKGELFYGQEVEVKTMIEKLGNSSFVILQQAWQHGECCAEGRTVMVRYDFASKSSELLSDAEREALSAYLL
ncbi:acyl-CoA thioesterase [Pseudoalteromonas luteoviolacea]|uniref:Thioesterase n=2 Tax=Pseudoalteromonas luteoviolacea TaxID=43657 RepID=A0A167HGP8_9GAMM|nr:thioesterase family protein [Pseudoalteromonas luteoviolacea]KZN51291.1 thioesterase [Pseudoalteromonas luteoviolacea H33]KZN58110.1 thioesterase [Pseudoalteromonas luteoviolacea CPMOR-1]KZN71539.1 thioesterase [Pseudoalteromonas luteoviolacea H33-S]MBQ4876896.1 acyl-CoA thioesterase [Pseudoalteromonas luteoviolacea]MBQ4905315.1 acyl-CoA thioesterase [Pseudoalteromonas luteoviolacea]